MSAERPRPCGSSTSRPPASGSCGPVADAGGRGAPGLDLGAGRGRAEPASAWPPSTATSRPRRRCSTRRPWCWGTTRSSPASTRCRRTFAEAATRAARPVRRHRPPDLAGPQPARVAPRPRAPPGPLGGEAGGHDERAAGQRHRPDVPAGASAWPPSPTCSRRPPPCSSCTTRPASPSTRPPPTCCGRSTCSSAPPRRSSHDRHHVHRPARASGSRCATTSRGPSRRSTPACSPTPCAGARRSRWRSTACR